MAGAGGLRRSRAFRASVLVAVLAVASLVGSACQTTPAYVPVTPDTTVWMAGDSISATTGFTMLAPKPYVISYGGSGFTLSRAQLIGERIMSEIDAHGAPEAVMIMGGVIDVSRNVPTAETTAAMAALEADLNSLGVDVIWLHEPGWDYAAGLQELTDWIDTRPLSIDCRDLKGSSTDGIHPDHYSKMSKCIGDQMLVLGYGA